MEFLAIFALLDSAGGAQGHDLGEGPWHASGGSRQANGHEQTATARKQQRPPQSPFLGKSVGQKFARERGISEREGEAGKITYLHPTLHCARQTSHCITDNGDKTAKIAFRSVQNAEIGPVSMNYYDLSLWFFCL